MKSEISLREWVNNNRAWELKKDVWDEFLRPLIELYKTGIILELIYKSLEKVLEQKVPIEAIKDIEIRERLRAAVAGGLDTENSYAEFMFNIFGLRVLGSNAFEESKNRYLDEEDTVTLEVNDTDAIISTVISINRIINSIIEKLPEVFELLNNFDEEYGLINCDRIGLPKPKLLGYRYIPRDLRNIVCSEKEDYEVARTVIENYLPKPVAVIKQNPQIFQMAL